MMSNFCMSYEDVVKAQSRIAGKAKVTPVLTCKEADRVTGRQIFFKAEHLQCTGAFKARGALNAVKVLAESAEDPTKLPGIVTHSSGNHGQALSWAAAQVGLPCTIVVPRGCPECKMNAIRGYGAKLLECEPNPTSRRETMEKVRDATGQIYISSSNHPDVMAGQGTMALELLAEVPDLDAILVTISGGGMASGVAVAAKHINPNIKIILVTPKGKMMSECLKTGERLWPNPPQFLDTIADGIRLQQVEPNAFEILKALAEKDVIEVGDEEIIQGMKFSFHRMKQVVEAAAGAAVAALFTESMAALPPEVKKVGVIVCGGNTDVENLPWYQ